MAYQLLMKWGAVSLHHGTIWQTIGLITTGDQVYWVKCCYFTNKGLLFELISCMHIPTEVAENSSDGSTEHILPIQEHPHSLVIQR